MKKQRVAIVVQQCGTQILAGAERYALNLAFGLSETCDVEIFTSMSDDYLTWKNSLTKDEVPVSSNGMSVRIRRFPVTQLRERFYFAAVKRIVFLCRFFLKPIYFLFEDIFDSLFLRAQGPWCPELWKTLEAEATRFDLVIFKTYLYAPTYYGLQAIKDKTKSLLIVTAHDEPPFYLAYVRKSLDNANFIACVSRAEKALVERVWPKSAQKTVSILSPGVDSLIKTEVLPLRNNLPAPKSFFLVLGRIDAGKNIKFILENSPPGTPVVLAGELHMPQSELKDGAHILGRVSEQEKQYLLQNCLAVVIASQLEAFSISTAEAIASGCLVVALKGSPAVEELVSKYGGIVSTEAEFPNWLRQIATEKQALGVAVPQAELARRELSWSATVEKVRDLLGAS